MSLTLRFWGTRGSIPSPGPSTVRYGGNTPCVEVHTSNDRLLILDAGTGLRDLGRSLLAGAQGKCIAAEMYLTHAHWDHVQGIPFFAPLYGTGNMIRFWSPEMLEAPLERILRDQMGPAVFPVSFNELAARIEFCEVVEGSRNDVGFEVSALRVRHPGGALGYRFLDGASGAGALVYIPDNELGPGGDYATPVDWRSRLVRFAHGARVLVHDATYTSEEYEAHRGWGHSTCEEAVELALECEAEQLVLYHHMPERSDEEVDRSVDRCRELAVRRGGRVSVVAAEEGMSLTV